MKSSLLLVMFFLIHLRTASQDILNEALVLAQQITNEGYEKLSSGDTATAEQCFLKAIETDLRVREAYMNLNRIYKDQNKPFAAVNIMEKASEVFYDDDEVWYYLGNGYYYNGHLDKAISAYDEAIKYSKINGEDFELVWSYYFNKGNALAKLKKYDECIEYYTRAIHFNDDNPTIYFNRGMVYLMINEKEVAKQDLLKACELGMEGVDEYINKYFK